MKNVAVLFSGGLDSTYLVWKNLKDGNTVYPIYVEITNNDNKVKLETNRIKLLHTKFYQEFDNNIKNIQFPIEVGVNICGNTPLRFTQMPIWIFSLIWLQGLEIDEIQIGYVMNDDAISFIDDIKTIYNSYQLLLDSKIKELVFPLIKENKAQMYKELPNTYRELIVSCENPKILDNKIGDIINYEPCCNCASCRRIINSDFYYTHTIPDLYKNKIKAKDLEKIENYGYKVLDSDGNEINYWSINNDRIQFPPPKDNPIYGEIKENNKIEEIVSKDIDEGDIEN